MTKANIKIYNEEEKTAAAKQRPRNLAKLYDAGYLQHSYVISNGEIVGIESEEVQK